MPTRVGGKFEQVVKRDQVALKVDTQPDKQTYAVNSVVAERLLGMKQEGRAVTAREAEIFRNPELYIEEHRNLIEEHVDRRMQLFFMQIVCCFRMPLHFTWIEANDEYGKGGTYKIRNPDGSTTLFKTEAAHSSTLPCLKAYPINEWEEYEAGTGPEPEGFVYLKYGHSYLQHNATMELARYVNRADCLLDGTHKDSKLRNKAIQVVNAVAKGEYSVQQGMKKFARLFKESIEEAQENLSEDDPRFLVLNCYLDRLEEVTIAMKEDPGYFDQLLGVKVEGHEKEEILRSLVYQNRFALIQKCEATESQIAREILTAQNKMLGTNKKSLKSVDYRLRFALLKEADPRFRKTLERLFCTSLAQLQAGFARNQARLRSFDKGMDTFEKRHKKELDQLKRDLRVRVRELTSEEIISRSNLFKGLRKILNKWTQQQFATAFAQKYPREAMSRSMVSRLEHYTRPSRKPEDYATPLSQRCKDMDLAKARKIADVFGVDSGVFLPALFSSE